MNGEMPHSMQVDESCLYQNPLTPALREIVIACVRLRSTDTELIAATLCRSPFTVKTQFQRINEILGTHSRFEAILVILTSGWDKRRES